MDRRLAKERGDESDVGGGDDSGGGMLGLSHTRAVV
jgi:hypothetical protein